MSSLPAPASALPLLDGAPLDEAVSLRAVEWLVALQAPDAGPHTQAAFQQWRGQHPDHARAWHHIESFGAHLRGLGELPAPLVHGPLLGTGRRARRRQALQMLALLAVGGGGAWLGRDGLRQGWQELQADHRTATGERRTLHLADGTRLDLNTASAVELHFDDTQRRVRLLHGEILIRTAPDPQSPARPFLVDTAQGRLRALGTRFLVRQHAQDSQVAVFEGAVEVRPADAPERTQVLQAGQQARFSRERLEAPEAADEHATTWQRGMLVARDMPLTDFIAELARHRPGLLRCDPALAGLRVSGIYPLADTDRVLDMLLRTQPIETRSRTRWWVEVRARGD